MPVEIEPDDLVSRCIIYDRFFRGNIHTDATLWDFGQAGADGAAHESGVLRRLAPAANDVHRIGCTIAADQNASKEVSGIPFDRRYYCGYRSGRAGDIPLGGDGYEVAIKNVPEHGENSHVDISLKILVTGKSARATIRLDAGLALAECFGPPDPHRCECDNQDTAHPFERFGMHCLSSGLKDRWPDLVLKLASGDVPPLEPQFPLLPPGASSSP